MWVPLARPSRRSLIVVGVALAAAVVVVAALAGFQDHAGTLYGDFMDQLIRRAPLGILLLLTFPLLVAIAARPPLGLLVTALILPLDGLRVIVHVPPFAEGYKQYLTIYVLLWSILTVAGKPLPKQGLPRYVAPAALYLAIGLLSAIRVGGLEALVGLQTSYLYLVSVPLALWLVPFNERERDWLVSILMLAGFGTAVYGLYQQVIGASGLLDMGYEYNRDIRTAGGFLRSFSTFRQSAAFGLFLMIVLLVCVPVALDQLSRLRNRVFLLTTPVMLVAMGYTFSRSAWIGLTVGATYLAFHRYRVLLFFAPFALPLIILLPGTFEKAAFSKSSFEQRQSGWVSNLNHAAEPFGNGIGTTAAAAEKTLKVTAQKRYFYQPDNNYYKVLYELGVFGLFFFVMMLLACLVWTREVEERVHGPDRAVVIGTQAVVLGVIVASFTIVFFEVIPNDWFFWLLMGTVASCIRESSSTPSR